MKDAQSLPLRHLSDEKLTKLRHKKINTLNNNNVICVVRPVTIFVTYHRKIQKGMGMVILTEKNIGS